MLMPDDIADLRAALAGDPEAFARLFDRHAGVVLSLCRRGQSLQEAEDAMQDTFLRAYQRLGRLRQLERFRPWLYAIARRVCAERRRSMHRRSRHEAARGEQLRLVSNEGQASPAASDPVEQAEQLTRLNAALGRLPERERLAIHLYYLEPDPAAAAYAAMGLSRSGFHKLLTRAREQLGDLMREAQTI